MKTTKVDTIIWDMDQTLYKYWDGVPEAFSEYTGKSACALANHYHGQTVNLNEAIGLALQSYKQHGLTTTLPALEYGLDEVELYRHHHSLLFDDYMNVHWHRAAIENDINQSFEWFTDNGIRSVVLTHGTCEWGDSVTKKIGIRHHFSHVCGIDSFALRLKSKDKSVFEDFMHVCGIKPVKDHDYSNVIFVEDTPANLVIPKRDFNMRTVLLKTDRVNAKTADKKNVDHIVENVSCVRKFVLQ